MASKIGIAEDPLHPNAQRRELKSKLEQAEKELKKLDEDHRKNRDRNRQVQAVARSCAAALDILEMDHLKQPSEDSFDGGDPDATEKLY